MIACALLLVPANAGQAGAVGGAELSFESRVDGDGTTVLETGHIAEDASQDDGDAVLESARGAGKGRTRRAAG